MVGRVEKLLWLKNCCLKLFKAKPQYGNTFFFGLQTRRMSSAGGSSTGLLLARIKARMEICWRFLLASTFTAMCHIIKPGGDIRVSHHAHMNIYKRSAWAKWRIFGFQSAGISEDTWGILWHHIFAVTSRQMPLTEGKVIIFLHSFPTHITSQLTSSLASCSLSRNQPDKDFKKWKYN